MEHVLLKMMIYKMLEGGDRSTLLSRVRVAGQRRHSDSSAIQDVYVCVCPVGQSSSLDCFEGMVW